MSGSNPHQHRQHPPRHHGQIEFYEYLMPGIYDYPVTHSAASAMTPYNLPPILGLRLPTWTIPAPNPATYVAGPFGLINYVSDMESHLALPTIHTLVSGMIYEAMSPNPQTTYPHQMLCDFGQIEPDNRDNYGYLGYGDPAMNLCFNQVHPVSEEEEDQVSPLETARDPPRELVEGPVEMEPVVVEEQGDVRRSSKRGHQEIARGSSNGGEGRRHRRKQKSKRKRVYEAEQGYLVEEPTSDASEEEDPGEVPNVS
ncbi:hypothetical protein KR067_009224 [Drosophila pandora]|nr:hypothetical protein KR067_009224 [Drosophila pandora]